MLQPTVPKLSEPARFSCTQEIALATRPLRRRTRVASGEVRVNHPHSASGEAALSL